MEATTLSEARVYVGTYGKYNNGSLFGTWLNLSDYLDKEDFYEACRELHKDEEDAEFMFQDWENVPEGLIGESWISENFFTLRDAVEQLGDTEQEAFFVWCNYKSRDLSEEDADDLVRDFWDEYQGSIMKNLPVICSCAIIGWTRVSCSGQRERIIRAGCQSPAPPKKDKVYNP